MKTFFKPKKRLGQNFLLNNEILKKITSLINIEGEEIVEIGPGKGNLTKFILEKKPSKLFLIEKDITLKPYISKVIQNHQEKVILLIDDALTISINNLSKKKIIIIANLPYNIATTLILNWLLCINSIKSMILMVQKEVALRLSAVVKTKNYGRISVLTQVLANVDIKFDVKPENFYPKPKVDSSVIKITPKKKVKFNYQKLNKTLTLSFLHKRKTLKNNLSKLSKDIESKISECGINPSLRPEEIKPHEFVKLSENLF